MGWRPRDCQPETPGMGNFYSRSFGGILHVFDGYVLATSILFSSSVPFTQNRLWSSVAYLPSRTTSLFF